MLLLYYEASLYSCTVNFFAFIVFGSVWLLLGSAVCIISASLESELAFNTPSVGNHVIHVEVLVGIVPANHVQEIVIVEDIVGETTNLGQGWVSLHQALLDIESEALMRPHCLVESTEDQNSLAIDRHAHGQIACCPSRLRIQGHISPLVVIDIILLDRVSDLFLVKLGAAREYKDVLVVEDAACCRVTGYVQVGDATPSVVLDVILLTSCVEALCIVSSDDEDKTTLRVKGSEVRSLEQER